MTGIMNIQQSDTFCPLKWDELVVNAAHGYVYACCKAAPMTYVSDINEVLAPQRENLDNGVRDPSCEYCWKVEAAGGISRRIEAIRSGNRKTSLEINLGNECNFQCAYCGPKFSSQWENDIRSAPYKIFVDRDNYSISPKSKTLHANKITLSQSGQFDVVRFIGGEPLLNKQFWELLPEVQSDSISVITNLSFKDNSVADRLLEHCDRFEKVQVGVSIDAGKTISEFVRYGIDYDQFCRNLEYLMGAAPNNLYITVQSLMTSITILDISAFAVTVSKWRESFPRLWWEMSYCQSPKMQSFASLPMESRSDLIEMIDEVSILPYVSGANAVKAALISDQFNSTLYNQMRHFLQEFAARKQIEIPVCLD